MPAVSTVSASREVLAPSDVSHSAEPRWGKLAGAAVVMVVTVATFLPTLGNGFVSWDDATNFLNNTNYRGLHWANLRWMFTSVHLGHYIPVTWLTLGLDYVLWGMNPKGYHLTALLLHATNAILFYLLAGRLLKLGLAPGREGALAGVWLGAAVAALIFAVHPLRVESVAWVTERRDLVCGLFTLLAAHGYLTAWSRGDRERLHSGWYWATVLLFVLALLSKSIVVGLPLVLLVLDFYPLRRLSRNTPGRAACLARLVREKAPFLALSAALTLAMLVHGARHHLLTSLETLGIVERLGVSGYGLAFYLWKTLLPWPLSPFYELHHPIRFLSAKYLGSAVGVLAVTLGFLMARRRYPAGLAAWVAYVVLLLPVIGIVHNGEQSVADRYSYLPCLGWALLAGAGVSWCWRRRRSTVPARVARLVLTLSATVVFALAGLSGLQIRVWHDSETLWRQVLAVDPESAFGHYYLAQLVASKGRFVEARAEFERAVELAPDRLPKAKATFCALLGTELQRAGDLAGAERNYRAALAYWSDQVVALNNLGGIQALRGQRQEALDSFRHVLRVKPGMDGACSNLRALATSLGVTPPELESCPRPGDRNQTQSGREIFPSPAHSPIGFLTSRS